MATSPGLLQALVASARREGALLLRRPWDLAFISWVPLLGVALVWWIFSAGQPRALPIGVLDADHSSISRQLTRFLAATPGLHVAQQFNSTAEAEVALRTAQVYGVVLIPRDLARDIKQGQAATVTLLHNAQLGTHSSLIQRDVRSAVGTLSAGIEMSARTKRGEPAHSVRVAMEPLRADLISLFNASTDYEQFLAAALIPALLHILAMGAGAWMVGRELRDRSVADWLGPHATWPHVAGALLGKLLWPWLGLSCVALFALCGMTWGRGWHPAGSVLWTALALAVFMALSIALGAWVAALSRSLRTALSATGFVTAPAFAFGGVGFPLLAMPWGAQAWARALPYTHYIRVQMEQLQMGAPLAYSLRTPMVMSLVTVLLLAATVLALRKAALQPASWGKR